MAAALLLALPWYFNQGARFLMPSAAVAGLALGAALARPWRGRLAWAAVALQAIVCWPQALNLWQPDYTFRLHGFPLAAALRIEPQAGYLARTVPEYQVARMVDQHTPVDARIFSLQPVANAYLPRAVTVSWQSAQGERIADALHRAFYANPMYQHRGHWPAEPLMGLRFRLPAADEGEFDIAEVEIYSKGKRVPVAADWTLIAQPNPWEAPLALDHNYATRWRTWQPIEAGMTFEIDFAHPAIADAVALVSDCLLYTSPLARHRAIEAADHHQGRSRRHTQEAQALPVRPHSGNHGHQGHHAQHRHVQAGRARNAGCARNTRRARNASSARNA